jgi:hypothetical protein
VTVPIWGYHFPVQLRTGLVVWPTPSLSAASLLAVALVLGDNVFYSHGLPEMLVKVTKRTVGATIFWYSVNIPEQYGVIELDGEGGRYRSKRSRSNQTSPSPRQQRIS